MFCSPAFVPHPLYPQHVPGYLVQGITYAVFGLGNKQYEHFNAIGKKAFKLLGELGASPLIRWIVFGHCHCLGSLERSGSGVEKTMKSDVFDVLRSWAQGWLRG